MADPVYLPCKVVEWSWDDVRRWGLVARETGAPAVLEVDLPPGWAVVPGHVRRCVWVLDDAGHHRAHAFLSWPRLEFEGHGGHMWLIPRYDWGKSPGGHPAIVDRRDGSVVYEAATAEEVKAWRDALYLGRGAPQTMHLLPDGSVLSNRAQNKVRHRERGWRYVSAQLEAFGAAPLGEHEDAHAWLTQWRAALTRAVRHPGNHKYAWPLRRRVLRREVCGQPYPKAWP